MFFRFGEPRVSSQFGIGGSEFHNEGNRFSSSCSQIAVRDDQSIEFIQRKVGSFRVSLVSHNIDSNWVFLGGTIGKDHLVFSVCDQIIVELGVFSSFTDLEVDSSLVGAKLDSLLSNLKF